MNTRDERAERLADRDDDQRPDTIAGLGNPYISTPNLDALLARGTYLRPYTTAPICPAARAEILTGGNSFSNGCRWFGEPIDPDKVLLPRLLRDNGYHCIHPGKWHNDGHPRDKGYHETHRVFPPDLVGGYYRPGVDFRGTHDFIFNEDGKEARGHSTVLISAPTVEFITRSSKQSPWFCYVAFHSPHDPRTAPQPWASMYRDINIPLPDNFMPEHPFDNGDMLVRDESLAPFPRTPEAIERHLRDCYAMISHHDHHIGRILAALDATGQAERTLILFTSDHGLAIGSHGLLGKENLYEHSVRIPMIWSGPEIQSGRRIDETCLSTHYDLMPTLLERLRIERPGTCEGLSYGAALNGAGQTARTTVCAAYRGCMRMARDDRFKLIEYPNERSQLFDLKEDANEARDLLASWRRVHVPHSRAPFTPVMPWDEVEAITNRLRKTLREWQGAVKDPILAGAA